MLFERQLFNLHRARPPSPWVLADMSSCDIWGGETGTSRGWLAIRRWLSPADARDISPHLWRRRCSRQTSANSCVRQRRARGGRSLLPCAWGANILQAPCDFFPPCTFAEITPSYYHWKVLGQGSEYTSTKHGTSAPILNYKSIGLISHWLSISKKNTGNNCPTINLTGDWTNRLPVLITVLAVSRS